MTKESLVFAALERLAKRAKDDDLSEYLGHTSLHSDAFLNDVKSHHSRLADLDAFTAAHRAATAPGNATTYTQDQLDAIIANKVAEAMKHREPTYTQEQLDDMVADKVAEAMAKAGKSKGGSD